MNPSIHTSKERKYFPNLPSKFSRVKTLKDKHKGEKMFIVATGPSLTLSDLEKLKGHLSMGMNSIVMSYDKTDWRPDYYVIVDCTPAYNIFNTYGDSYDLWHSIDPGHIILSHYFGYMFDIPKETILVPSMRSRLNRHGKGEIKFSADSFERVCESYTGGNDHAFGFEYPDAKGQTFDADVYGSICAYTAAKKYADAHGIKIFNATRG